MGFFSALLGLDHAAKARMVKDIDVMDAINAHVRWKVRLDKYVHGTSDETLDPQLICRDDQCALGKWIHGAAQEFFKNDDGFSELRDDHAKFHIVASQVVAKVQENDTVTAEAILKGEYQSASRKVVNDLTELSKQLAES